MSYEIYGDGVDEFVVGLYCLKDFPEINLYINVDESKILRRIILVKNYLRNTA